MNRLINPLINPRKKATQIIYTRSFVIHINILYVYIYYIYTLYLDFSTRSLKKEIASQNLSVSRTREIDNEHLEKNNKVFILIL